MHPFPEDKIRTIKNHIDQALDQGAQPIAAFDADGTLWECDMGEGLFKYQIKKQLLPYLPPQPWEHYLKMHKETSPPEAFLWLAQINEGKMIDEVRGWADSHFKSIEFFPYFEAQKEIISHLQAKGVAIYIVTASTQWAVEPAASIYNIPKDQVIGVATKIKNELVTTEQSGAITWREGKVKGLLEHTNGKKAFFCAGNTTGDLPLLESATHLKLVIASAPKESMNYKKERHMLKLAKENNWFSHDYIVT